TVRRAIGDAGGRVAEELVFGDVSTGAENDLDRATSMARHMVTRYGMSERIGLATLGEAVDPPGLPGFEPWGGAPCSEDTARLVDEEIRGVLNDAHERVAATLRAQRAPLERIARLLLERDVLDHEMLQQAIEGQPAPVTA
ncbi:cell division protein FtsH, partial [Paraburkholderia sp. JHI2823]